MKNIGAILAFCTTLFLTNTAGHSQTLSLDAINLAQWSTGESKGPSAAVLKAQVLLDRAGFSPGVIDARGGENFGKALTAFQSRHGLDPNGKLDEATWAKLMATSPEPVVMEYEISAADVKGPFVANIPRDYEQMAKLERLGYRSARQGLAEKFHMSEDLLKTLNAEKSFDEKGARIVVAAIRKEPSTNKAAKVEVNKSERSVRVLAADGTLIAYYPASVGSEEKPAPDGLFEVRAVAENPTYRYNPDFAFKGQKAREPVEIAAGPNNPSAPCGLRSAPRPTASTARPGRTR